MDYKLSTIEEGIEEIKAGRMLIVVDSPNRENQGDIIFSAQFADLQKMNFVLNECRGMTCVALSKEEALRFDLPVMVPKIDATEKTGVQFTLTVDHKDSESFGISSADRVRTVRALGARESVASDFVRPGHIFPLLARDGGVLERQGHTEATADFCRLAGLPSVGLLAEILKEDGEPARLPELVEFSKKHTIKIVSVEDLHEYLKKNPLPKFTGRNSKKTATAKLPTCHGTFDISVYKSVDNKEHVVMVLGNPTSPALTRIHSECLTGDALFSQKCDCRAQLDASITAIGDAGSGVLIYLNQEGRNIGLTNKIKAYALQDEGRNTIDANVQLGLPIDAREYSVAAEMLHDLGINSVRLLTNNPIKLDSLKEFGITISERVPLITPETDQSKGYIATKKDHMGHLF